eukprot:gene315-9970_t
MLSTRQEWQISGLDTTKKRRIALIAAQLIGGIVIAIAGGVCIGEAASSFAAPYGVGSVFAGFIFIGLGLAIKETTRKRENCRWQLFSLDCKEYNTAPAIALCILLPIVICITIFTLVVQSMDAKNESQLQASRATHVQYPSGAGAATASPYPTTYQTGNYQQSYPQPGQPAMTTGYQQTDTYQQPPYSQPGQPAMATGYQPTAPPYSQDSTYPQGAPANAFSSTQPTMPPVIDPNVPPPPTYNETFGYDKKQ